MKRKHAFDNLITNKLAALYSVALFCPGPETLLEAVMAKTLPPLLSVLSEYSTCTLPLSATGSPAEAFCSACFTGNYPVPVPDHDTKHALEAEARVLHVPGTVERT